MTGDRELKVGDKIKSKRTGLIYAVKEIEGRFALVDGGDYAFPILFHNDKWSDTREGEPWEIVKPRWWSPKKVKGDARTLIYDGPDPEPFSRYAMAIWHDDSDLTHTQIDEAVQAIVDLLNERYP